MTTAIRPSRGFPASASAGIATATLADPGDAARWFITGIQAAYDQADAGTVTLTTGLDTLVFQLNVLTSKLELDFTSPIECKHSTAVTGALSAGTGVGKINVFGYQA
jgi:hypothetical protein